MPRVGDSSIQGGATQYFAVGQRTNGTRQHSTALSMPESGFITLTGHWLGTDPDSSVDIKTKLTIHSGASRALRWSSSDLTVTHRSSSPPETPQTQSVPNVPVVSGEDVWLGVWAYDLSGADYGMAWTASPSRNHRRYGLGAPSSVPDPLEGTEQALGNSMGAFFDYIPNSAPDAGAFEDPTPPDGGIGGVNPTFRGTTPHPAADASLDHTSEVHLQIWRADTGEMAYDNLFATTQAEKDGDYYERLLSDLGITLLSGTTYRSKFRHRDYFGTYSPFSAEIEFTTSEGPDTPSLQTPTGKINALGGYNYEALYTHPNGIDSAAWQVQVYNSTGSELKYDSGEIAVVAASGSVLSMAEWHADLAWATSYKWRARVKDSGNSYSQYSAFADFNTDSPPDRPVAIYPVDNQSVQDLTFTASLSDPDGDPVAAAQIEIVDVATNTVVTGYPKAMTVNTEGTEATFTPAAGELAYGDYKWRARADDGLGPGYGEWSGYEFFKYAEVPTATFLFPRSRTNLVRDPSAEGTSTYWTETARTATDYIDKVSDGDAAYGIAAWSGVSSGAATANTLLGEAETVEAGRVYLLAGDMKKVSDELNPSATHLRLACYDGTGTRLADVYPDSIQAANGADVEIAWTRYGGLVWPEGSASTPALPAGTATIRPEWIPSTVAATVRADAFSLEPVGRANEPVVARDAEWHGYSDPSLFSSGHTWSGTAHDSESSLLPVLTAPAPEISITYSSASGLAKKDDRLRIERQDGSTWTQVHDSGYPVTGSDRTRIPVPGGILKNEGRYRIKVMVRDTNDTVGETPWQTVDIRYDGPAEPLITVTESDPAKAEIRLRFTPPDLTDVEFVAYEVLREAVDGSEPRTVVDRISDPATQSATYRYPVSGKEYILSVRAVALIGSEPVEGRRSSAVLSVDYWPYFFIKDVDDPDLYVAYEAEGSRIPAAEQDAPSETFMPWGAERPTVLTRRDLRIRTGEVVAEFYPDALMVEDHESRYEKMRQITERRRTICILRQVPDADKVFASIQGQVRRGFTPPRTRSIEFAFAENSHSEDYFEREGL